MAKPVRSRLDRLVEESRQRQAAPYLSKVYPLAAALLDRAVAMQGTLGGRK